MQSFSEKTKINGLREIYDKDGYLSPIDIITKEDEQFSLVDYLDHNDQAKTH